MIRHGARFWPADRLVYERSVAAARAQLAAAAWDDAQAAGQAMTADEACAYALEPAD